MGSNGDHDIPRLQQRARRALRIGIAFAFLLAFFWSVNSFFVWLFLGAAVYCLFLAWFYNSQTMVNPTADPYQQSYSSSAPTPVSEILIKRLKLFLPIILGMVILAIVVKMSGSTSSDSNESLTVNQSDDVNPSGLNNNQNVDSLTNKGNNFYNQGNYDSALIYYNQVLKLDPGNQFALYDLALVYYGKKDYRRTVPLLMRCLREHPDYGDALWLLGDVYYDRKNLDSAKVCFDRAYQTGLRSGAFLQLMAGLYESVDKPRAIELYKQSLQQDSTLVDSYKKLAESEPDDAQQYLRMMKRWTKSNK